MTTWVNNPLHMTASFIRTAGAGDSNDPWWTLHQTMCWLMLEHRCIIRCSWSDAAVVLIILFIPEGWEGRQTEDPFRTDQNMPGRVPWNKGKDTEKEVKEEAGEKVRGGSPPSWHENTWIGWLPRLSDLLLVSRTALTGPSQEHGAQLFDWLKSPISNSTFQ